MLAPYLDPTLLHDENRTPLPPFDLAPSRHPLGAALQLKPWHSPYAATATVRAPRRRPPIPTPPQLCADSFSCALALYAPSPLRPSPPRFPCDKCELSYKKHTDYRLLFILFAPCIFKKIACGRPPTQQRNCEQTPFTRVYSSEYASGPLKLRPAQHARPTRLKNNKLKALK